MEINGSHRVCIAVTIHGSTNTDTIIVTGNDTIVNRIEPCMCKENPYSKVPLIIEDRAIDDIDV